jgi:4'-phosphopantetheinyl transferase
MLLHLYATEYLSPLPDTTFLALLTLLPTHLQQKVLRFRGWQDRHAGLLGKLLLRIALKNAGGSTDLGRLHYTIERKPFFPEGPAFNIQPAGEPPTRPTVELHELTITHWHDLAYELRPF